MNDISEKFLNLLAYVLMEFILYWLYMKEQFHQTIISVVENLL